MRLSDNDDGGRILHVRPPSIATSPSSVNVGRGSPVRSDTVDQIGTYREGPLHASLKEWLSEPGDQFEVPVGGFVIDLVRGDLLVEVQTGGFTPLRRKLDRLLETHRVRIVHPIAVDTWIVRMGEGGEVLSRRRSPKHQTPADVFAGLVSITDHLGSPNLEIDVVSTVQQQVRRHEEGKAWRRKGWVIDHRSLVEVSGVTEIRSTADLMQFVPAGLDDPFTTADLAEAMGTSRRTAQQVVYCLRSIGTVVPSGIRGRAPLFARQ